MSTSNTTVSNCTSDSIPNLSNNRLIPLEEITKDWVLISIATFAIGKQFMTPDPVSSLP